MFSNVQSMNSNPEIHVEGTVIKPKFGFVKQNDDGNSSKNNYVFEEEDLISFNDSDNGR